eukprot:284818964_3
MSNHMQKRRGKMVVWLTHVSRRVGFLLVQLFSCSGINRVATPIRLKSQKISIIAERMKLMDGRWHYFNRYIHWFFPFVWSRFSHVKFKLAKIFTDETAQVCSMLLSVWLCHAQPNKCCHLFTLNLKNVFAKLSHKQGAVTHFLPGWSHACTCRSSLKSIGTPRRFFNYFLYIMLSFLFLGVGVVLLTAAAADVTPDDMMKM